MDVTQQEAAETAKTAETAETTKICTPQSALQQQFRHVVIYCPDIVCESCVKILTKLFQKMQGVRSFVIHQESMSVEYDEGLLTIDDIFRLIHQKGYRASLTPFVRKRIRDRLKEFISDKKKYELEYRMLAYTMGSFLLLVLLEILAFYGIFHGNSTLLENYGWYIFYLNFAVVSLGAAIWHFHAYRANITCMVGMMVGMTIGMQTGFMLSTIMGATNGMFMGSVVGVILGVGVGVLNGKCCGIMGVMEGMMAGLMGGTMGSMVALMMKYDYLLLFMPLFMFVNLLILWGISYMLYEEVVEENPLLEKKPLDFFTFFSVCLIVVVILLLIMLYGYRSPFGIS